jgi:hypothetical protein
VLHVLAERDTVKFVEYLMCDKLVDVMSLPSKSGPSDRLLKERLPEAVANRGPLIAISSNFHGRL